MKYIVGYKKDMLTVVEKLPSAVKNNRTLAMYRCKCDCGNVVDISGLKLAYSKSCGCLWHNIKPIKSGTLFGRLKVIEKTDQMKHHCYVYKCECQCNKKKIVYVRSDMLRNGDVTSCGCIHDELLQRNVKKAYDNNFIFGTSLPKIKCNTLQSNNTSGYPGVSWHKGQSKWVARIQFRKKTYSLGYYDDPKLAAQAYQEAKKEMHGDFLEWYRKERQ